VRADARSHRGREGRGQNRGTGVAADCLVALSSQCSVDSGLWSSVRVHERLGETIEGPGVGEPVQHCRDDNWQQDEDNNNDVEYEKRSRLDYCLVAHLGECVCAFVRACAFKRASGRVCACACVRDFETYYFQAIFNLDAPNKHPLSLLKHIT
jgi:hypothetical protein